MSFSSSQLYTYIINFTFSFSGAMGVLEIEEEYARVHESFPVYGTADWGGPWRGARGSDGQKLGEAQEAAARENCQIKVVMIISSCVLDLEYAEMADYFNLNKTKEGIRNSYVFCTDGM